MGEDGGGSTGHLGFIPPHLGLKLTIPPHLKISLPPHQTSIPPWITIFFRAVRERLTLFLWCNNSYLFHNEIYILVIYKMQGLFIFSHLKAIETKRGIPIYPFLEAVYSVLIILFSNN